MKWMMRAVFCWLVMNAPLVALAAKTLEEKKNDAATPTAWAPPYILVVLAIGLGIMMVVRPVRRDDKRREE